MHLTCFRPICHLTFCLKSFQSSTDWGVDRGSEYDNNQPADLKHPSIVDLENYRPKKEAAEVGGRLVGVVFFSPKIKLMAKLKLTHGHLGNKTL